jgi:hypothetical protein
MSCPGAQLLPFMGEPALALTKSVISWGSGVGALRLHVRPRHRQPDRERHAE